MAIEATTQILYDGMRNAVIQITGRSSDGSGQEVNAVKVDVSTLNPPANRVAVRHLTYDVADGSVTLSWAADTPVPFAQLEFSDEFDYCRIGGMQNGAEGQSGVNGDILLSTRDFVAGSLYTIQLDLKKKY